MTLTSSGALRSHVNRLLQRAAVVVAVHRQGRGVAADPGVPARGRSPFTLDGVLIVTAAVLWSASVVSIVWASRPLPRASPWPDLAEPALDLLAAVLVLRAVHRPGAGRVRLGGAVICVAMLVYAAGDGIYAGSISWPEE